MTKPVQFIGAIVITIVVVGRIAIATTDSPDLSSAGQRAADAKAAVEEFEASFQEDAALKDPPVDTARPEFVPDEWPQGILGQQEADLGWAQFENAWADTIDGKFVAVYAGSDPNSDKSVGALMVEFIEPTTMKTESSELYETPIPGPVKIDSYKGAILTVVSEKDGSAATFDVATGSFD